MVGLRQLQRVYIALVLVVLLALHVRIENDQYVYKYFFVDFV